MQISEAESVVMEVLWRRRPLVAKEVVVALRETTMWQESTVKTFLNRLLHKGAVSVEKIGRQYLYSPILQREKWLLQESVGLLGRLFDGRIELFVKHMNQHDKLSAEDINALRTFLLELEGDVKVLS